MQYKNSISSRGGEEMAGISVNICDFGAVPGAEELQTDKIQAAIDHCFALGGGEVVVPEGIFRTGGIRLRSDITLHLLKNACLKGSRNPEDYFGYKEDTVEPIPDLITDAAWLRAERRTDREEAYKFMRMAGSRWNNALIRAIRAENVAIIGEENSVLDGSDCFDERGEENYRGPHCVNLFYCKNVTFRGYIVKDSANWAHALFYCKNITADHVTALAGHDGIHMTACENIEISNCEFYTGDDCVAGFGNVNVLVNSCELNSACSAMRFGGTNVLVENCHIYGPCKYLFRGSLSEEEKRNGIKPRTEGHRNNMLSVFTYYADFSIPIAQQPGNIVIKNCKVEYADRFLHYNYSGNEMWQQNRPLQSISFENIEATDISMPLTAYGDSKVPLTLKISDSSISFRKGYEDIDFMHVCNYDLIELKNVKLTNYHGEALLKKWSEGKIFISGLETQLSENKWEVKAEETFYAQPI